MSVLLSMEGAVAQGLLWGLMALGVYLTFRILNVADMTVDGSFACGGAVTAALIASGISPSRFLFYGFLNAKQGKQKQENQRYGKIPAQFAPYLK